MTVIAIPQNTMVYYGWPHSIQQGALTIAQAAAEYAAYDNVIWGDKVQLTSHGAYTQTQMILQQPVLQNASTRLFGYIPLANRPVGIAPQDQRLTQAQIRQYVSAWGVLDAIRPFAGILLDEFGYDFGVTRDRQNFAVNECHAAGFQAFANAFDPDDAFLSTQVPLNMGGGGNPNGVATLLTSGDHYMLEDYWIGFGVFRPPAAWREKSVKALAFRDSFGVELHAVDVMDTAVRQYLQSDFDFAYLSALVDEMDSYCWGEQFFGAGASTLMPFRPRPALTTLGGNWSSGVYNDDATNSPFYRRDHDFPGTVNLNTTTHIGTLTP